MNDGRTLLVTGLGRCGTSLVMQMLAAADFPIAGTAAYPDFEDDRVLGLDETQVDFATISWMGNLGRAAIKVLDPFRMTFPSSIPNWDIIWLDRNPAEQARSVAKMLSQWGGITDVDSDLMVHRIVEMTPEWTALSKQRLRHEGQRWLSLTFEDLIEKPEASALTIARFIGRPECAVRMADVVFPRAPKCLPFMLEEMLLGMAVSA